jgi:CheY-like chemotaxis protein
MIINILIIDNDPDSLSINSLMMNMSSPFFKIDPFVSSPEALSSLRKNEYNFIISNLEIPEIDGFHLIKEAKSINPNIFSILITEKDISNLDPMISEFKIDTCIKKPYTFTRLLSEITIGIMNKMGNKAHVKKIIQGLKDKIISSLTEGDVIEIIKCSLKKEMGVSSSWRFVPANIFRDWSNIMWENHKLKVMDEFQKIWINEKVKYSMDYKSNVEPVDKLRIHRFDVNDQLLGKPIIRYFKKDEFEFCKDLVIQHYSKDCEKIKATRTSGYLLETDK